MDTIKEMGDGETFTDDDFEACFKQVDLDGSGTIDQEEMLTFIKVVANIEWLRCDVIFIYKIQLQC